MVDHACVIKLTFPAKSVSGAIQERANAKSRVNRDCPRPVSAVGHAQPASNIEAGIDALRASDRPNTGRLHLNWFGLETNQLTQVVLVPTRRQPLVGDAHLQGAVLPQEVVGDALEGTVSISLILVIVPCEQVHSLLPCPDRLS